MILKSGKILNRADLEKEKTNNLFFLNDNYSQNRNEICLALHPNNQQFKLNKTINNEDAFYDFIMYHISIILKSNIILNNHYLIMSMPGEIRIGKSILLSEYIDGIGYYDKVANMTEIINKLINNKNYDKLKELKFVYNYHDFLTTKNLKQYIESIYKEYYEIKRILKTYKYDIPIVDPYTGIKYTPFENNLIKAEETLLKIKKIREKI